MKKPPVNFITYEGSDALGLKLNKHNETKPRKRKCLSINYEHLSEEI